MWFLCKYACDINACSPDLEMLFSPEVLYKRTENTSLFGLSKVWLCSQDNKEYVETWH